MILLPVSYTHLRAHETRHDLVCRLLLEKKKPPPSTRVLFTVSYIHIVLNITPTLYEGHYIVSVRRMVILWKIVLLTLAASRGVTDLYPS